LPAQPDVAERREVERAEIGGATRLHPLAFRFGLARSPHGG